MVGSLSSVLTEVTYGKICSEPEEKPRISQWFSLTLQKWKHTFCKLTDVSCSIPWFPSWMQLVQRQNSSDYFKSLADGLHINSFALLASLNVHLPAETVLSNGANPKCQPQARAARPCRCLQKAPCADASLQVSLMGLWGTVKNTRVMQYSPLRNTGRSTWAQKFLCIL